MIIRHVEDEDIHGMWPIIEKHSQANKESFIALVSEKRLLTDHYIPVARLKGEVVGYAWVHDYHDELEPSAIGKYVIDLAQAFNKYYGSVRILSGNDVERAIRLQLAAAVAIVLKEGLRLLGIEAPEEM